MCDLRQSSNTIVALADVTSLPYFNKPYQIRKRAESL